MSNTSGDTEPVAQAESTARTIARYAWVLPAIALAAPLVSRPQVSALTALTVSLVLAGVGVAVAAVAGTRRPSHSGARALIAIEVTSFAFAAVAAFAPVPQVALWGGVGQHNGAALWLAATGFSVCFAFMSSPTVLRRLLAVLSVSSAVYALTAIAEALFGSTVVRWGSAAGVLENSSSLGQYLVLGVAASVAWAASERSSASKLVAGASGVLSLGGMAVATSRAGLLGVLAATAVAMLVIPAARSRAGRALMSVGLPVAAVGLTAGGVWVAIASESGRLGTLAARVLTERDAIWQSAWTGIATHPFQPRGLEQFSAWVVWSIQQGVLRYNGTYDAHNWVLSAGIAGGVLGLLLLLICIGFCIHASVSAVERSKGALPLAVAFGGIVGVAASALLAWFAPVAVIGAASLFGALVGAVGTPEQQHGASPRRIGLLVLAALCIAAPVIFIRGVAAEYTGLSDTTLPPDTNVALYEAWPDPAFASRALFASSQAGNMSPRATALLAQKGFRTAATYHVDAALAAIFAEQAAAPGAREWQQFQSWVDAGRAADPSSGIWDTIAAVEADKRGLEKERRAHARRALGYSLSDEARALMEQLSSK